MARPLTWLPRLHDIRRSVVASVRSHYTREELERLFELQPRQATRLLEMLPTQRVGTALLVEREALAGFLDRVREADDVAALFRVMRAEKVARSNRKLRSLVRRDLEAPSLLGLPAGMVLDRGRVEIGFGSVEELGRSLLTLALLLESEGDEFARQFEPEQPEVELDTSAAEVRELFAELERTEQRKGPKKQGEREAPPWVESGVA